jgi:hypothetical protein
LPIIKNRYNENDLDNNEFSNNEEITCHKNKRVFAIAQKEIS